MHRLPRFSWKYRLSLQELKDKTEALCKECDFHTPEEQLVAQLLTTRGIHTRSDAEAFLNPTLTHRLNPLCLPSIHQAINTIENALRKQESILLVGDYDVDGICATAIMYEALKELGASQIDYYIPDRYIDGYGISPNALGYALARNKKLIIALDCGTKDKALIELALASGIKTVVIDHHEPHPSTLPPCPVVNPHFLPTSPPLTATTLAMKTVQALATTMNRRLPHHRWIDLVTLSILADAVPLLGENRALVIEGLKHLPHSHRQGLHLLMDTQDTHSTATLAREVLFGLIPQLNAAGRVAHARQAVEMLINNDTVILTHLADALRTHNHTRKTLNADVLAAAITQIEENCAPACTHAILVAGRGWHRGVIGIVAARLAERYGKPTAVLSIDENGWAVGSLRSILGINLQEILAEAKHILDRWGGHEQAAGITIRESKIGEFARIFEAAVAKQFTTLLNTGKILSRSHPTLLVDAVAEPHALNEKLIPLIEKMAPFGTGNPIPTVQIAGVREDLASRKINDHHLLISMVSPTGKRLTALWLSSAHLKDVIQGKQLTVVVTLYTKKYNHRSYLNLQVEDLCVRP